MSFRIILFVCFGFLVIGLWGCGGNHDKAITSNVKDTLKPLSNTSEVPKDTIIHTNINGKLETIQIPKYEIKDFFEIKKIAIKFKNRPLDTSLIQYLDITGDGITEKIVSHLFVDQDSVCVTRKIFQNDTLISKETKSDFLNHTDGEYSFSYYGVLQPYNCFHAYIRFLDVNKCVIKDPIEKFLTDSFIAFAPMNGSDFAYEKKDKVTFLKYLKKFKGVIVGWNTYESGDLVPEVWYAPKKIFVELSY